MDGMGFYDSIVRPLAFRCDPEWVHAIALRLIKAGLFEQPPVTDARLKTTVAGIVFENPLGLAAGFAKDAEALDAWRGLGFGFVEVGTVTPLPQPGNPRPRLFRLPEHGALVNRMGFNNAGAEALVHRLSAGRPGLPVGINIGKNSATPLKDAPKDYAKCFRLLRNSGDYFVINVSSPNTPGLRELQDKSALKDIAAAMLAVDASKPIFVKVAPDLEPAALDGIVEAVEGLGLAGIIATNTTNGLADLRPERLREGGLSGKPLAPMADALLAHLHCTCRPTTVIIAVGGVFDGDDIFRKIGLGAHLCQTYTGFVYGGPAMAVRSLRQLTQRLDDEGIGSLDEWRGSLAAVRV